MTSRIYKNITFLLGATAALFFSEISTAQPIPTNASIETMPSAVQFVPEPPPDQGAPDGRQRGGGTRGDCLAYQDLTALVPQVEGVVWSQTVSAAPIFFFRVPANLNESIPLELVVQDSRDNYVFRRQFSADAVAGTLAVSVEGLASNEIYTWTFSIYCDAESPSDLVYVSGTIERRADVEIAAFTAALSSEEKLEVLEQYAAAGIWHEAIALAIELFYTDPNNNTYAAALSSLLTQAGLTDVALTPLFYEIP